MAAEVNWERIGQSPPPTMLTDEEIEKLSDTSPRLFITRPTLILSPGSPTGWLLIIPQKDDDA